MTEASDLAGIIDHTILKPDATLADLDRLAEEAMAFGFCSVCVNSVHVAYMAGLLADSNVRVCSVVGFPLGAMHSDAKAFEAKTAVADGAREIDMVMSIGHLKSGLPLKVEQDISKVRRAVGKDRVLKVIIEAGLLTEAEKINACRIAQSAGADFVKTSTGFAGSGATTADVALMRKTVGPDMGVKASGGIKDREAALAMTGAGADRIGTSSGPAIVGVSKEIGSA